MNFLLRKATDWLPFISVGMCCLVVVACVYVVGVGRQSAEIGCRYDEKLANGLHLILDLAKDAAVRRLANGELTQAQYEQNIRANDVAQALIADPDCKNRLKVL